LKKVEDTPVQSVEDIRLAELASRTVWNGIRLSPREQLESLWGKFMVGGL
jgi:hypothetical protein